VLTTESKAAIFGASGSADEALIRSHLEHLLASHAFANSRRSQTFLRYVVEETLAGRGGEIKERNIATDVFGKGEAFESQTESIVRVNASEVRRRLKTAYESGGVQGIRIDLPLGSYHPIFYKNDVAAAAEPAMRKMDEPALVVRPSFARRLWQNNLVRLALLAAMVSGAAIWAIWNRPATAPLDLLWQPFVQQSNRVVIALPAPAVVELRSAKTGPALLADKMISPTELGLMDNYYVGVGAALGAARFAEQLTVRRQAFDVKFGSDLPFADLASGPAILLGGFTSVWGLDMTRSLRFHLETAGQFLDIVDSRGVSPRWRIARWRNSADVKEGYALITRLLHSETGHPLLVAAGIHPYDTLAAVEFLTERRYFDEFAKRASPDWARQNFQVVLHENAHGHSPGAPVVVAYHVW
jgi:hypothetical protein